MADQGARLVTEQLKNAFVQNVLEGGLGILVGALPRVETCEEWRHFPSSARNDSKRGSVRTMDRSILGQLDPRVLGARLQDARKVAGLTQQAAIELQRLAEDYAGLERTTGVSTTRSYPPLYEVTGAQIEQTAAYVASAERNRLGLGDGPIGNLRERLENGPRAAHLLLRDALTHCRRVRLQRPSGCVHWD